MESTDDEAVVEIIKGIDYLSRISEKYNVTIYMQLMRRPASGSVTVTDANNFCTESGEVFY